jgi:hypothetical protein
MCAAAASHCWLLFQLLSGRAAPHSRPAFHLVSSRTSRILGGFSLEKHSELQRAMPASAAPIGGTAAAAGYPVPAAARSGHVRYGAPGGRTAGGSLRGQYLESDGTVSPQILGDGEQPYAMDELEQAITDIDIVGFTVLQDVLSHDQCVELQAVHQEMVDSYGTPSGTPEDGDSWHVANLPTLHPAFWQVCDHPRVMPIIEPSIAAASLALTLALRCRRAEQ